ncbi:hypothetical protein [Aedes camptorhynchus negev-like virus]|uniref:hypothetical protein n=1 Tax=Aedes camptorhynchus negev-like virus TaxID=2010268 RepID=UPI000B4FBCEE|nr:hypothetical protein CFB75_gp5 [Aedes camptorhynchus negev-like virus]ASA47363.1 hypothetical protein [Aedes camptorhynchus negev-like virus]
MENIDVKPTSVIIRNQVDNSSIFTGLFEGYYRIIRNPLALSFFIIGILGVFTLQNATDGPLELIIKIIKEFDEKKHSEFLASIVKILIKLSDFLLKYKEEFYLILLLLPIPIIYTGNSVAFTTLFLIVFTFIYHKHVGTVALVIQSVFLYYSLDNLVNKVITIFVFVYLVLGQENLTKFLTKKG